MATAPHLPERLLPLRHARARVPLVVACSLVLAVALGSRSRARIAAGDAGLAAVLAREGLSVRATEVVWLEPPSGPLSLRSVLLLAHRKGEPDDVYYAEARQGGGSVLDLFWLTNLTRSSSATESGLTRVGSHVAFSVEVGEGTTAIVMLDLRGEPETSTRDWPLYARIQNALTNLQETGRLRGFGRRDYRFVAPRRAVELAREREQLVVYADGARLRLAAGRESPLEGAELVSVQRAEKGRPGTITWVVDTVRNLSFVGPGPIDWLEHTVFGLKDRASRTYHGLVQSDGSEQMQSALAATTSDKAVVALPVSLRAGGFPPPRLLPVLSKPGRSEGEWVPVADEAFVNARKGAPPAFYQTFLRVDPERPYVSVFVTLWDPRRVQLHVAMGTAEPESATGETGTGLIPRDPELLRRLVAGFNGGFQALHGEFGMMTEGRVYLPPKPWAATVAVFEDGRVGMGSWRGPDRSGWDEARANAQIPADMTAMRQNLTSVVEDGRYNPWKRWWWGAAPEWAEEQTYIARSGLCLTTEGHMAFLWGESMGPDELGKAMLAARCMRGIHLDMNAKHTGLEFYKPLPPGAGVAALTRALGEFEFEGPIEHGLGFEFRSRLAVKVMSPLRFPRYLGRDPRDFFYLTLKSLLPGPALRIAHTEVEFMTDGLPEAGFPHAFARAELPSSARTPRVWLVRIDPARAVAAPLAAPELDRPLARLIGVRAEVPVETAGAARATLCATRRHGLLRYEVGALCQKGRTLVEAEPLGAASTAARALGVDREGFLLYAESDVPQVGLLQRVMEQAGAAPALALPAEARLAFQIGERRVAVDGKQELTTPPDGLAFMAETRPAAGVMFPEVKPMPYYRWGFLQGQRVRYFPSGPPRFPAPPDVLTPLSPASHLRGGTRPPAGGAGVTK